MSSNHKQTRGLRFSGTPRLDRSRCASIRELFDNDNPIEMDIGAGKGKYLLARAQLEPERNFIGIDYIWKYLKIGWKRVQKRGLTNILFFKAEALEVIKHLTPSESVSVFHIYFPDPWHKRKHKKRRYMTPGFISMLNDRLVPGGLIELATDNFDYYIWLKGALAELGPDLWRTTRESLNERLLDPDIKTNFELKYEAEERDLYYLELQK
jgi:tRNA (guanine-N7-)-methyltransferase